MKRIGISIITGALCAIAVFLMLHANAARDIKFRLGIGGRDADKPAVEEAIRNFNRYYTRFFVTGGSTEGLNEFPAANMVKRRIFQEIENWSKDNKILAYDKFEVKPISMEILSPERAVTVTHEVWALIVREREGLPLAQGKKTLNVQVRYILGNVGGRWIVEEFEIYGPEDAIPPLADVWKR